MVRDEEERGKEKERERDRQSASQGGAAPVVRGVRAMEASPPTLLPKDDNFSKSDPQPP